MIARMPALPLRKKVPKWFKDVYGAYKDSVSKGGEA